MRDGIDTIETAPPTEALAPLLASVFPGGVDACERVAEGVSTWVYRLARGAETFYLRILPEPDASFAPEVAAHEQARKLGVRAPAIVWYRRRYEPLGRSVMVTAEVAGRPLSASRRLDPHALDEILLEAGRDLARLNSIRVEGFGWVHRASAQRHLRAPLPSFRAFAVEHWDADLAYLTTSGALTGDEGERLRQIVARHDRWLDTKESLLAHGDFDTTAIYQQDGRYSGMIDFGELRGANRWYDLGHYHMRDGEFLPAPSMRPLVRGYSEVTPLPIHCGNRIMFASLLINVRALSRSLHKRPPNRFTRHQFVVLRSDLAMLAE